MCFTNEIPRADKLFRCCQRSIIIWSAPSAEQAAEAAKKEFAEFEGIRDWKIHASLIEVEARDRRIGAVLVTEGDHRLLGIFTGRDALHRVLAEGKSAARTKLAEVMTRNPDTMPPGRTAIEPLRLMEGGRYRHVPIVDGSKVVGIVSRLDFSGIELDRLDEETGLWERI